MFELKALDERDYKFNLMTIDRDYKNGILTREEAFRIKTKMTERFKSGDNNREIEMAARQSKLHRMK